MDQLTKLDTRFSRRCALPVASPWWRLVRPVAHLGDGLYVFGGLVLFYLLGWLIDDMYLRQANLIITVEILLVMLTITLIKYLIRRERPQPPGEFVTFRYDAYSFPSGHAARMAALAMGVTFFFPTLAWLAVGVALGVALARVVVGVHYVGDILAGIVIGIILTGVSAWLLQCLVLLPTS